MDITQDNILCFFKKKIFIPLYSTTIFYICLQMYIQFVYSFDFLGWQLFLDWIIQLIIAYILSSLARRIGLFLILQFLLMLVVYIGNIVKISILGSPLSVDDIYSFSALYNVLNLGQKFLLITPILLIFILFIINFKFIKKRSTVSLVILLLSACFLFLKPQFVSEIINSKYKFRDWSQIHNYRACGATIYFISNAASYLKDKLKVPKEEEVEKAIARLGFSEYKFNEHSQSKRNVILILMESLWDPMLLKNVNFSEDPFDHDFRKLWDKAGNSYAMSSAYGGLTANPEFEILTGHPANLHDGRILFQNTLKNKIPALPAYLKNFGYESAAFHPYIPSFWNRVNAYNRLGFERYYSINDFKLDDMNSWTLSDESLYRQVLDILEDNHSNANPKLIYIVTLTGHWPFLLNEKKRPIFIKSDSSMKEVTRYANLIRYNTKALMEFINHVLDNSPDSLIVISGDHLPALGNNFKAYADAGLLTNNIGEFNAQMFKTYVNVPLLIINGQKGPVDVGTVSMHEIPGLIIELLEMPANKGFDFFKPQHDSHVRPLEGLSLVVDKNQEQLCRTGTDNETCRIIYSWLENIKVLDKDILFGRQFSLNDQ